MPAEYAEYLAANMLNEQQLVCLISRLAMLLSTNTQVGELPLAEQSLEGPCQFGKAVCIRRLYMLLTSG
jgi:hypothetical protein